MAKLFERFPALPSWKYGLMIGAGSDTPVMPTPFDWSGRFFETKKQASSDGNIPVYPVCWYLDSFMAQFDNIAQQWMTPALTTPGLYINPADIDSLDYSLVPFIFQPKRPWNKSEGFLIAPPKAVLIDFNLMPESFILNPQDTSIIAQQAISILQGKLDAAGIFIGGSVPWFQSLNSIDDSMGAKIVPGWLLKGFPIGTSGTYDPIIFQPPIVDPIYIDPDFPPPPTDPISLSIPNFDPTTFIGGDLLVFSFIDTGASIRNWFSFNKINDRRQSIPYYYFSLNDEANPDLPLFQAVIDPIHSDYMTHDLNLFQTTIKRFSRLRIKPYRFMTVENPSFFLGSEDMIVTGQNMVYTSIPTADDGTIIFDPITTFSNPAASDFLNFLINEITDFFNLGGD